MDELKPCPFCGAEARVCGFHYSLLDIAGEPKDFCVICNDCSASSYHYANTPDKAIAAWNRRANDDSCKDADRS